MSGLRRLNEDEMRVLLLDAYQQDPEENFMWRLVQHVADPIQPSTPQGRRRFHPMLLVPAILILVPIVLLMYTRFVS